MGNQAAYLKALGIKPLRKKGGNPIVVSTGAGVQSGAVELVPDAGKVAAAVASPEPKGWGELAQQVSQCQQCELCQTRSQTVFGVGDRQADIVFVGEAPGADEDAQGEPFVGNAGKLLTEMLFAIGLKREQVYIANILKCRPPNNRDPRPEEVQQCIGYLQQQLALLQPRVIVSVGRISAQNLLDSKLAIGKLRGQLHHFAEQKIPLVVTYHPAYLLRSPGEKRKAWDDLLVVKALIEQ